jgi:hypothetical protein
MYQNIKIKKARYSAIERSTTELLVLQKEAPDVSRTRGHSKVTVACCKRGFYSIYNK